MSQQSDDYSRGFNKARELDRESVRILLEGMYGSQVGGPQKIEEWLDSRMPLEEPEEDEYEEETEEDESL